MRVKASELNVRSGPGTSFRVLYKLPQGTSVDVLEAHGDWVYVGSGWVHNNFLEDEGTALPVPNGRDEIVERFGLPGGPACQAGTVRLPAPIELGWERGRYVRSFKCHTLVAEAFTEVYQQVHAEGLWDELGTFDGCYNGRAIKGTTKLSTHAWAIAVDHRASDNLPLGSPPKMHPRIVEIFKSKGFTWGGDFARLDGMHFQYAKGY